MTKTIKIAQGLMDSNFARWSSSSTVELRDRSSGSTLTVRFQCTTPELAEAVKSLLNASVLSVEVFGDEA